MGSWNELLSELDSQPDDQARAKWLDDKQRASLAQIGKLRGDRNVIFYASAFLQKPSVPPQHIQLTSEELNGFMSVVYGLQCAKGLTLILHTPGGQINAAETVAAYLHSKFNYIEVIVPTYAFSAGTMLSLAADRIIMGRQSQLGPTDPQMPIGNRSVSACAIVDQFDRAKREVKGDVVLAHVWAPILQHLGPALLQEANNALGYAEGMVARWLEARMFQGRTDAAGTARRVAAYFRASEHQSHGRRIDRDEARAQGVVVDNLEDNQPLQDAVLTAYHLMTIIIEKTVATKILLNDQGRMWVKNLPILPTQKPTP